MPRLLLIDAYSQIYRAFFAFSKMPRINSKGQNTSAIFGFVNTMEDVIRRVKPTHVAIVFDPEGPTFRHQEYAQYKANRDASPEEIHQAVPIIKQIAQAYHFPAIDVPGYEADDVVGTLAYQAREEGFEVFMLTPDKDYGQLVKDGIYIFRPRSFGGGYEQLGVEEIKAKWGVSDPAQVRDILGLMGDKSDNIPGCNGVGEKNAVKLINQFSTIENMLANIDQIKGAIKNKIEAGREDILLSQHLATIKTDVPVKFVAQDCEIKDVDIELIKKIYTDLEFNTLLSKIIASSPASSAPAAAAPAQQFDLFSSAPPVAEKKVNIQIKDWNQFDKNTTRLSLLFAVDEKVTFLKKRIKTIVVSSDSSTSFLANTPEQAEQILALLKPLLEDASIQIVTTQAKELIKELHAYDVALNAKIFDVTIAHYLIQTEQSHAISILANSYLGLTITPTDTKDESGAALCEQAAVALSLQKPLEKELAKFGIEEFYRDMEIPLTRILAKMELTGVPIDEFALMQSSMQMTAQMAEIEAQIRIITGSAININSPRQVGELLFETLRIADKPKKTKTGQYVTDEATLQSYQHAHPVVEQILKYRELKKLLSTYIDALPPLINPLSGRVHTVFNQTVTATGRLSSSNPNLQNIPIREQSGKQIRRAFIAPPGYKFLSADYSQIELRLMADFSNDEHMVNAFQADEDIHAATAAKVYHVDIKDVTPEMRRHAKTANFGIIYGISAFGLSERLGVSRQEAKQLIDDYFVSFPRVKEYIDSMILMAHDNEYVSTLVNRRRYLPDINSRNNNIRSFAERNAVNAPIQGSAADIIKMAMVKVAEALEKENLHAQMILQVHDELNFLVPCDEVEKTKQVVTQAMENAYALHVPLRVDVGVGDNWLDAH